MDEYMKSVADKIAEYGICVQGVFGDPEASSFVYSVGMTEIGQPEVMICGLNYQTGGSLLNDVHAKVKAGEMALTVGTEVEGLIRGDYKMMVCAVTADHEANVARVFFGDDVAVVQLVFQDKGHHYPWELEYDTDPRVQKNWFIAPR